MFDFYLFGLPVNLHLLWVRWLCTFCSRALRMALTLDFLEGNILIISQLDLILPNFSMVSGLECIANNLRVILTPSLGLYDE